MITEATIYTLPDTRLVFIATGQQPSAPDLVPVEAYFLSDKNGLVRNKHLDGHYLKSKLVEAELVELNAVPAGEELQEVGNSWQVAV